MVAGSTIEFPMVTTVLRKFRVRVLVVTRQSKLRNLRHRFTELTRR